MLNFWPLELWEKWFLLFKPLSLWYFVFITLETSQALKKKEPSQSYTFAQETWAFVALFQKTTKTVTQTCDINQKA